jgi:hypothetical protein
LLVKMCVKVSELCAHSKIEFTSPNQTLNPFLYATNPILWV